MGGCEGPPAQRCVNHQESTTVACGVDGFSPLLKM